MQPSVCRKVGAVPADPGPLCGRKVIQRACSGARWSTEAAGVFSSPGRYWHYYLNITTLLPVPSMTLKAERPFELAL